MNIHPNRRSGRALAGLLAATLLAGVLGAAAIIPALGDCSINPMSGACPGGCAGSGPNIGIKCCFTLGGTGQTDCCSYLNGTGKACKNSGGQTCTWCPQNMP